jgi:hypothetical protein
VPVTTTGQRGHAYANAHFDCPRSPQHLIQCDRPAYGSAQRWTLSPTPEFPIRTPRSDRAAA